MELTKEEVIKWLGIMRENLINFPEISNNKKMAALSYAINFLETNDSNQIAHTDKVPSLKQMNWKEEIHKFYYLCKTDTKCLIDIKDFYYLKDMYLTHEEELTIAEADELFSCLKTIENMIFGGKNYVKRN